MKSDSESFKRFAEVIRQRDELRAALEGLLNDEHALSPIWRQSIDDARAAIARAKGENK